MGIPERGTASSGASGALHRYLSILKTFQKVQVMSRAFEKHHVNRNTVVSTAAIGEIAVAATERCMVAIQGDLKTKIEGMKTDGKLLPIGGSKAHTH
ncbi:unnamed protein product [Coregonus sp. 'balchen']|nr:unnamed protein product [Coregonus sp. 'balchen']